jgi:hypothetical protein
MMRLPKVLLVLAVLVLLAGPAAAGEAVMGTIKSVTADKNQFVLRDSHGKDALYTLVDAGKVRTSGDHEGKLGDLKEGAKVLVTFIKVKDGLYAMEVRAASHDGAEKTVKGTIKKVETTANRFVLTDEAGKEALYTLADDGRIWSGDKEVRLVSLKEGSNATVHFLKINDGLYATGIHLNP